MSSFNAQRAPESSQVRSVGRFRRVVGVAAAAGAVAASLFTPNEARALAGGAAATPANFAFAASVRVGRRATCSGALIAPRWIITAKSCFASAGESVVAGPPTIATTATIGRADLRTSTGHVVDIVELVPADGRNLVLARLRDAISDITPIRIATTAPKAGDSLSIAGYGRTASEWTPDLLNSAAVTVGTVDATTFASSGSEAASTCKGDSGGPALRQTASGSELVALHDTSWQRGCLASTETRVGLTETRVDDLATWITSKVREPSCANPVAPASISDGQLLQEPGGKVALVAAGMPFEFATPAELTSLGYDTKPKTCVPDGSIAGLPHAPRERALLRDPVSGAIYIIAGGGRLKFNTVNEYLAVGYKSNAWTNVPSGALLAITVSPRNGTLLHDPVTGGISVVVGGANVTFVTWQQFLDAGYKANTWVDVPFSTIWGLPSVPIDGTMVRNRSTGAISLIAGGANIWFANWPEYVATGYPAEIWVHVPSYYIPALPTTPKDGTLLRYPNDSTAWRITGGRRQAVTPAPGATVTVVPARYLDGVPRSP
jgi:hypothetical protein